MSRSGPNTANADYANTKGITVTATLTKGDTESGKEKAAVTQPSPKPKGQTKTAPASTASTKWYYEDCAARCDSGGATPNERSYCYAQICSKYPKRGR
jgi:hypothetical protein